MHISDNIPFAKPSTMHDWTVRTERCNWCHFNFRSIRVKIPNFRFSIFLSSYPYISHRLPNMSFLLTVKESFFSKGDSLNSTTETDTEGGDISIICNLLTRPLRLSLRYTTPVVSLMTKGNLFAGLLSS